MKKKVLCQVVALSMALSITACGESASDSAVKSEISQEESAPSIDAFRDYAWGTSLEDIKSAEVTDDMKELLDYQEQDVNGMIGLTIKNGNVAGYDTEIGYIL